jgi:hypothetical protein
MNNVFDYNGTFVSASKPVKSLKKVKKTFMIDSSDRDIVKYVKNGDIVVYLPRVYENVVSLRLMAAEFPAAPNTYDSITAASAAIAATTLYVLMDIEGLNKTDECSLGADRSGFPDGYFAKIPLGADTTLKVFYNDHSAQENIAHYTPAIAKLDRLHIRTRLHTQKNDPKTSVIWDSGNYSLSFEIEYLDNVFDDFSQFESRISTRS